MKWKSLKKEAFLFNQMKGGEINEGNWLIPMGSKLKIYLTKFHENILAFSIIKNFKTQKIPRSTANPPPSNLSQNFANRVD